MGKLEKKKTPLEGDKQVKISAFFQAGGPVKSKLFSSIGNVPKPAKLTLNKSTLPAKPFEGEACEKHFTPEARQICDKTNKFTSISVQNCIPPNKADVTKGTNHKFLSPERSAKMADPVSASPDVVMIPDTPEEKQKFHPPKKKVFTSRSFLTTSVSPISRDPPPKIVKKRKSKLDGMVSVMFNEPGAQTKEHNFDVNENNEAVLDLDVKSDSVTPTKEYKSDRVKRLAKSGLSPTPKRSLCLDSEVLLGSGTGFNFSSTEDKSVSTENKILPKHKKTNVEKILSHMSQKPFADQKGLNKKLHNYQIGGSKHESPSKLELSSDDDVLGKILGELGSKSCSKSASRFREKAKIQKSDTVAKSVCHVEDMEEEKDVLNELLNELGPKSSGRTEIVKGSNSSGPIARKDFHKSATVMGAMTAEERKLFKTLDDSFGSSTAEMMSDSESPSIIMPKRRQRDAKAPVEGLFKDFKNNESADGGDRDLVRMTDEVDGVEELIDDKDDSVDGGDVKLADDMSTPQAEQEFADFKETGSAKKENDVEHVMTDVTSGPESQELCSEFTHLTPFAEDMSFSEVCELPPSCRPADRFNRFRVSSVQHNREEIILNLMKDEDVKSVQSCILHGFWLDTHVAEGDIVHILGNFGVDGVCHITDQVGLIVICPDLLLSGTSVVSGVHCMRRSVLNEKFKGCDDKSIHMLFGSVIHCLFQQVLKQGLSSKSQIQDTAKSVMMLNKFLHEMYSHVTHETVVQEEIDKYIVPLQKWLEKYSTLCPQTNNAASSDAKVSKVHDIEENIWSPRFGVKGKIDLTVEIEMPDRKGKKILPLELKTGKPTFSIEHKGQVTLYSMMMSDRRADPEEGLLLYLREPVMTSVAVKGDNKRGLIQLRNELAHYVSRQVSKTVQDGYSTFQYGPLPKPINSVRTCSKCPQLVNCSIYQSQVEHLSHHKGHAMESLVPETLQHLQQTHLDYFLHWSLCLELEGQVERGRSVKDIWCQSSQQREKTGDCLSGMVIRHTEVGMVTDSQRYAESDSCIITFVRHPEHARYYPSPLHTLGFAVNDTIAISTDDGRLLVLSTGFIRELREREVVIVVDRDIFHEDKELKKMTFRLDRCDNFNTLGYLFTNLSRLMANQGSREKLRQLIIDKKTPEFQLTMSKGTVEQVKPIFKSLNKPQKTAILKILMSKDYVLIRGFPGTGKTSTIVALVRILTSLGQSVLLTSYTHSAVDNILLKLKQHNVRFLRLGRLGRIHPEISEYSAELLTSKITSVHELRQFYDSQKTGDCLSGMVIRHTEVGMVTDSQRYAESDSCIITFVRHPEHARYYPSPLHTLGFAVNDTIAISTDDGRLLVLSTGFIRELREREVVIVVDRDIFHEDKELKKMTFRLDRCDNFNTLGYLFTNLSRLMANQGSREKLRQLIIDKKKPEFQLTMSKGTVEQVKPIFKSLNKPQKTAILKILMSKDYVLIRGFPGTGKTSTIVALVRILTSLGQSVLLTSYTHSAVDNILLKLKQHNVRFLRLGRLGRIHPEISEYSAELLTSKITSVHELRQFYDSQRVVATSCLGTNHPLFSQRRFDVCIVDEASQVLQPACLGPLFAADKFVLVGDPKQLPPVVQSKEARELGMSESLFNHLDDMGATFDLNWQYRMNTTIMHLSNELVYGGLLKCGSSTVAESTLPLMKDARVEDVLRESPWLLKVLNQDLDQAAVFLDTQQVPAKETCDGKGLLKNVVEADLVLIILRALLTCGVDGEDIGVIAPYRHQVKYLQQRVFESRLVGVEVNTVDQYQGRDKSVIIMSFVRSSTNSSKSGELLQDTRRLNVAVTRAKCKLILVGDVTTLRLYEPLKKIISTMEDKKQIYNLPLNAHR